MIIVVEGVGQVLMIEMGAELTLIIVEGVKLVQVMVHHHS